MWLTEVRIQKILNKIKGKTAQSNNKNTIPIFPQQLCVGEHEAQVRNNGVEKCLAKNITKNKWSLHELSEFFKNYLYLKSIL